MARGTRSTRTRLIAGVRVSFVYNMRTLDIRVAPSEDDLRSASLLDVLRVWETVARWAAEVPVRNPGWTVNGRKPFTAAEPDPEPDEECEHVDSRAAGR